MTKGLNRDERRNAVKLVLGKTATKLGDTLTNPKTVLTWLLTTIGAPGAAISMLVPIRESGSMLPQLFISGWVQRFRVRKWVFAGGAAAQALAIAAMGLAAMTLNPTSVGVAVIILTNLILLPVMISYIGISKKAFPFLNMGFGVHVIKITVRDDPFISFTP
jgi:hypothetical protein